MVKKSNKLSRETNNKSSIVDHVDKKVMSDIMNLFKKTKKGNEFEFIFFSKKGKYLPQEKYIQLLKYYSTKAQQSDFFTIPSHDMLDISYQPEIGLSYRCTINDTKYINKLMKSVSSLKNHVVFKTFLELWKKKNPHLEFMKKEKNGEETIDVDEFDMRVRLSKESDLSKEDINSILQIDENMMRQINYRFKQRTSIFIHGDDKSDDFIRVDITCVKMSNSFKNLNKSVANYELEIEYGSKTKADEEQFNKMIDEINLLLKITQNSNYIISNSTILNVKDFYYNLFSLNTNKEINSLESRQPISLEIQHVTETLPNKYAVTDKADGDRSFMIIYNNKVFFMSTNMNIKDTGIVLDKSLEDYNGTVLDGELIFIPSKNRHVYLAFDCLFYKSEDVRTYVNLLDRVAKIDDVVEKCFIFGNQIGFKFSDMKLTSEKFDLRKISEFHHNEIGKMIGNLNNDIDIDKKYPLIRRKYMIGALGAKDWEIFVYASTMWNAYTLAEFKCPYHLDGLIFSPLYQKYISDKNKSDNYDYKWKEPTQNSFDFYVEFVKDKDDNILTIYDNSNEDHVRNKPYRIVKLHVGSSNKGREMPVIFKDSDISSAYIFIENGEVRDMDGDILSDKTVAEFYYNNDPEVLPKFRWVLMRTRYDKTESVIRFGRKYGNYSTTADKVWRSVMNPILMSDFEQLSKGNNTEKNNYTYDKKIDQLRKKIDHSLIISSAKENVYFQKRSNTAKDMRQFQNWVKSNIVYTFCDPKYQNNTNLSVLDIGCGKGQDIMKFYHAHTSFYVGLDIDREGLISAVDGAISRYNKLRRNKPNFPKMYFIQADASTPFTVDAQTTALSVKKLENEEFFKKFFSDDAKKRTLFDRINIQFTIHYMLRNENTWSNFKLNVNNHLRNGGYLLASTFDAEKVINLLGDKDKYTYEYVDSDGKTQILFDIIKKYDNTVSENNKHVIGVGNTIDVYLSWFCQEGRYLSEYLVDSRYIVSDLKKTCNLELVDTDTFGNQLTVHSDFLHNYAKFEETEETNKFLGNVANLYKSNPVNDGGRIWNSLFRYYVFRKQDGTNQKGGNSDNNIIDFSNEDKFYVPSMSNYNNEHSCINSVHHILKSHNIIPHTISPRKFCSDIGVNFIKDSDVEIDDIKKVAKKLVIEHFIENDDPKRKNKRGGGKGSDDSDSDVEKSKHHNYEKVINGVNIFIAERDCNNIYDIDLVKKTKKINNNDKAIILVKEGAWYVPMYYIDPETYERVGIFKMDHPIVNKMLDEV
jgi:SAM-dependent methyltransferase